MTKIKQKSESKVGHNGKSEGGEKIPTFYFRVKDRKEIARMLNDSIDNIRLDLNKERVRAAIYCRQGDTRARTIHCTLADSGKVVSLENALVVEILIAKADGHEVDNGCVVSGNEIQYTLRTNDIAAVGENIAQFQVTYDDGTSVSSPEFSIFVYQKTLSEVTQQSYNEYTALGQKAAIADARATDAEEAAASASTSEEAVASYMEQLDRIQEEIEAAEAEALACVERCRQLIADIPIGAVILGTGHTNAFYGDLGQIAYEHSQATGNPHGLTVSDIGAATSAQFTSVNSTLSSHASNSNIHFENDEKNKMEAYLNCVGYPVVPSEIWEVVEEEIVEEDDDPVVINPVG